MRTVRIENVTAREILDSRGNPTVEASVLLSDGAHGVASVPSGASTGAYEATELRDGDSKRYGGKGVLSAVGNVNGTIRECLVGMNAYDQAAVDGRMISADGTENKSTLGANAVLSVSLALARAAASSVGLPLYRYIGGAEASSIPVPMMNVLNGGAHASNNVDIQEFMIVPHGFSDFSESLRAGSEIYFALRDILLDRGLSVAVGDEGGFAPDLSGDEEALMLLTQAIERAGYRTDQVGLAIDAAASEWTSGDGIYRFPKRGSCMRAGEMLDFWSGLTDKYPILSIEDPFGEDDFESFRKITASLGDRLLIVGDDLFVTNEKRLRMGIDSESANAILVKPNQIGTVTEVLQAVALAKKFGYRHILSHRSGETTDDSIADLAVATSALLIKTGAPCRGERVAKYNRLLRISSDLGEGARFGF